MSRQISSLIALFALWLRSSKAQGYTNIGTGTWTDDNAEDLNYETGWLKYEGTDTSTAINTYTYGDSGTYHRFTKVGNKHQYMTRLFQCPYDSEVYLTLSWSACNSASADHFRIYNPVLADGPTATSVDYEEWTLDEVTSAYTMDDDGTFTYDDSNMDTNCDEWTEQYREDVVRKLYEEDADAALTSTFAGNTTFQLIFKWKFSSDEKFGHIWDITLNCTQLITPTESPTTIQPSVQPSSDPTVDPTTPTDVPTTAPTFNPSTMPTTDPTADPTTEPTTDPTIDPTVDPTADPTMDPTADPTTDPTMGPTTDPTKDPTMDPTSDPTEVPTSPTSDPTSNPTAATTAAPTSPTSDPTMDPTMDPTADPTSDPTDDPTADPTMDPTMDPTVDPTANPTMDPTSPTSDPTTDPTSDPTTDPTMDPTAPTVDPTTDPTTDPTVDPTSNPTMDTTTEPTSDPTEDPTMDPTSDPTAVPSDDPTSSVTLSPTESPVDSGSGAAGGANGDDSGGFDEVDWRSLALGAILASLFICCLFWVLIFIFWKKRNETSTDEAGMASEMATTGGITAETSV